MQKMTSTIRNLSWLPVLAITAIWFGGCAKSPEAAMAEHMAKGKDHFKARDYRRAILEFKNASIAKPKEPEPHYQLALAYFEAGDGASALAELRRTTALNPNHSGANAKLATLMVATRNPDLIQQGGQLARQALTADPGGMEALSALALAEMKTGKPEDAAKHLEQALAKFPRNMKAVANLASLKVGRRDFAGAEEVLKKAAAEMPKSSKPLIALGRFYLLVDRPDASEAQFRKALSLDPKDAVAMRDLAELLNLRGRTGDAEGIYKQLSALPYKASKPLYAMFLYRTGKRDLAVAHFEKLLSDDPKNRDLRNYLVGAYLSMGKLEQATKVITAALRQNPKDNDALLQRSQLYLASGEYAKAEADALAVLRLKSDSAVAHYTLAKVYQGRGSSALRREELTSALRYNPGLLQARLEMVQALNEANASAPALELLNQTPNDQKGSLGYLISRNWTLMALADWVELRKGIDQGLKLANASELLLQDGMLRVQQRDFQNARKSLELVLQRNPEDLRALKVLGGIYILQNQKGQALQVVEEYAQRRPQSAVLQNYLGQLLLAEGRTAQAKAAFLRAKAADPNARVVDLSLAQMDVALGNLEGARKTLQNAANGGSADLSSLLALAAVEQAAGRVPEAVERYRAVLERDPNHLIALNNLAYLLAEVPGQSDAALQYAQHAQEIAPADPMLADTMGWILVQKKMFRPAIEQLKAAVAKQPVAPIYYHLGVAYMQAGDQAHSRESFTAALKLDPTMAEARAALQLVNGLHQ